MKAQNLVEILKEKHLTIGAVESMTAGLFSALITEVPGASQVFKGSLVTYVPETKENLVGVLPETIQRFGVISWEVASEMAYNGRAKLGVDYCISIVGNAGPDVDHHSQKVGTVYIAVTNADNVWGIPLSLKGTRDEIRHHAAESMIDALVGIIK